MYKKKNRYDDEEYDSDNYAYQRQDREDDYGDRDDDDDGYSRKTRLQDYELDDFDEEKEDEIGAADPIDEDLTGAFDLIDENGQKKKFNPADYDFNKIMEDYNSGDPERKAYAVEQAVYAMDALVKHVINRHYPTYREKYYDDMLQEGRTAIVDTLGGYTGKCAPSSYFYTTIRHQIQVFVAEQVHRTTRHYAAMANKIRKAELALSQIDGKDYHDDVEISVFTHLPLTTVIETRKQTAAADFVELTPNMDTDELIDNDYGNPAANYWKEARKQAIHDAVMRLSPLESKVIILMYGLDEDAPMNAPEIARRLRIKTEQVRKISQDACRKLANDKRLKEEVNVSDKLTDERNKVSVEMPFVSVEFGKGENFFDEISEDDGSTEEVVSPDEFFASDDVESRKKSMSLKDE